MAKASVIFSGAVINVHVSLDNREISLVEGPGNKWTGSLSDFSPNNPMHVLMRFAAPANTDWALVVRLDGKKVLDDNGTSDDNPYGKTWDVPLPASEVARNG